MFGWKNKQILPFLVASLPRLSVSGVSSIELNWGCLTAHKALSLGYAATLTQILAQTKSGPAEVHKEANNSLEQAKAVVQSGVEALEALQLLMLPHVPRQKPKSGKFWKADRSQFRAIRNGRKSVLKIDS